MANIKYKLCPKCELNWITEEQDICDICKQLTKGETDIYDDIEEDELVLCPICNMNYILESEEMCENCALEKAGGGVEVEEEVENYDFTEDVLIPEEEEEIFVSLDEIEEEEEELAKEDEEEVILDDFDAEYEEEPEEEEEEEEEDAN